MSGEEPKKLENNIEEYPAGFLVPVKDSQAIATCLRILANNPEILEAKRRSALIFRDSSTGLDWSNYAKRAIKAYEVLRNQKNG